MIFNTEKNDRSIADQIFKNAVMIDCKSSGIPWNVTYYCVSKCLIKNTFLKSGFGKKINHLNCIDKIIPLCQQLLLGCQQI